MLGSRKSYLKKKWNLIEIKNNKKLSVCLLVMIMLKDKEWRKQKEFNPILL